MLNLLSNSEMRERDARKISSGTPSRSLMETAARAITEIADADGRFSFDGKKPLIVCGPGNNGGDGFAIARFIADRCDPTVLYAGAPDADGAPDTLKMSEECRRQYALAKAQNIRIVTEFPADQPDFLIDAIFGTGIDRPVDGKTAGIIENINASGCPVLSVDIPSGVNGSTGQVFGSAVKADLTVTVSDLKRGLFVFPGADFTGDVKVAEIGIAHEPSECTALEPGDISSLLPARKRRSNKGDYGRIAIFAGSTGMCGAAYLCAKACYRSGAGIVEIITPGSNRTALLGLLPEAIVTDSDDREKVISAVSRADAVVCGCGIGTEKPAQATLETVLKYNTRPLLLDADALNILAQNPDLWKLVPENTVVTPHPGEMSRLTGKEIPDILADMLTTAKRFAGEHKTVTLLKDAHTLIADGTNIRVNLYGNSGMATGGSGDVLSGIIGAFLGLKLPPFDAASLGALVHSLAGDRAAETNGERSMIASDMIETLKYYISYI